MVQNICQRLRTYIDAELNDAALYRELAKSAPADDAKLLQDLAQEEQRHAEEFQCLYQSMTGNACIPTLTTPVLTTPYRDILQTKVLDESNDFRKYGEQSLMCNQNNALRSAFCQASTDENVHALRLLYLLSKNTANAGK